MVPAGVAAPLIDLRMRLVVGGRTVQPRMVVRSGETFLVLERPDAGDGNEAMLRGYGVRGTARLTSEGHVAISAEVLDSGRVLATPSLVLRQGVPGEIRLEGTEDRPPLLLEVDASADPSRTTAPPAA